MGDYLPLHRVYPDYSEAGYNESCLRGPGQRGSVCQKGLTCQIGNSHTPRCLPSTVSQPPSDSKAQITPAWGARRHPSDQICSVTRMINGRPTRIMVPDEHCGKRVASARDGGTSRESSLCHPDCRLIYEQDTGRFYTGRVVVIYPQGINGAKLLGSTPIRRFVPCHPSCAEQPPPWMEFQNRKK